jgi:tetratricopeptide (TPR) repeat protein
MHFALLLTLLQGPRLGTIHFPTSGAAAAQEPFVRGVAFLHSFEYDSAARAFREAQRLDSTFALAYWGEAMTYTHPVWNQQDAKKARAVLARAPLPPTPRERAYLDAVRILYGEGSKAARDTLYTAAMRDLAAAYPEDVEARAFYALALLGLNQSVRDVATYMQAAAIAEEIFRDNPDHPGAAHYLIHSYDDPAHAAQGLRAARAYSQIAPDAPHAQHMTTHIFLALGLWDDVVRQNEIASGPHREHWGAGHYTAWLGYGLLQQGRHADARRHLEAMRANLSGHNSSNARTYLSSMRAHFLINAERWDDPARAWALDVSDLGATAQAIDAFALGYAAARRGDRRLARQRLADLTTIRSDARADGRNVAPVYVPAILARELEAAMLVADGKAAQALPLLYQAAAIEDSLPVEYGPPDVVKPTHELLGEVLLGLGRASDAQREFQRALEMAPRRALALLGLVRAATAAGDREAASRALAELRDVWHAADRDLPGLTEITKGPN